MKILALGDPHGELPKDIDKIIKREKIDLIICVGDFAFTPEKPWLEESWKGIKHSYVRKTYKEVVDKICSYGLPVLTLRGNMFMSSKSKKEANKILKKHKNLINKFTGKIKILNQSFVFFDIIYEKHNARTEKAESPFKQNKSKQRHLNKLLKENPDAVLVAHNPPFGYVDKIHSGKHVGSKILLNAIKTHKPKLVLCGHIHEAKGKAKIGKTIVYNLGCCGDYKILNV